MIVFHSHFHAFSKKIFSRELSLQQTNLPQTTKVELSKNDSWICSLLNIDEIIAKSTTVNTYVKTIMHLEA